MADIPAENIEYFYEEVSIPSATESETNGFLVRTTGPKIRVLDKDDMVVPTHDHNDETLKCDKIESNLPYTSGWLSVHNSLSTGRAELKAGTTTRVAVYGKGVTNNSGQIILNGGEQIILKGTTDGRVSLGGNNYLGVAYGLAMNNDSGYRAVGYSWELYSSSVANKTNIVDLPPQSANIAKIRPLEYDYKGERQVGIVVEDLENAGIKGIITKANPENPALITSWNPVPLLVALLKEVQDLRAEMEAMKK